MFLPIAVRSTKVPGLDIFLDKGTNRPISESGVMASGQSMSPNVNWNSGEEITRRTLHRKRQILRIIRWIRRDLRPRLLDTGMTDRHNLTDDTDECGAPDKTLVSALPRPIC